MKDAGRSPRLPTLLVWACVLVAVGAGVACAALLQAWILPRGHEDVWVWKLRVDRVPPLPWTAPAAILLLVMVLVAFDALRTGTAPSGFRCGVLVLCLTLASGALTVSMTSDDRDYPYRASAAVLADMTMGYYLEARRIDDARAWVRDVDRRTTPGEVPERVATHPPGPVLYFLAARNWILSRPGMVEELTDRFEKRSGDRDAYGATALARKVATFGPDAQDVVIGFWSGVLLTLAACLVVPLCYGVGCALGGARAGLMTAALSAVIPSLICFSPSVDGLGACLAAAVTLCWLWALRRPGSVGLSLLTGAVAYVALFWSFGQAALVAVLGVASLWWWKDTGEASRPLRSVGLLLLGLAGMAVVGGIALGYNPVSSFVGSMAAQGQIMQQRPYAPAVVWGLYDFVLFAGPALVVMALAGTVLGARRGFAPRGFAALGMGVAVTLLLLALSASTRGEVGRIWGFLMPLLAAPAALPLLSMRSWNLMSAGLVLTAAQIALAVVINSNLVLVAP